jgi:UDP-GlcNAc3NAcA epimerase
MKKLLTIIGARPQIIKSTAIFRAIYRFDGQVEEKTLHTGQHYDEQMSGVFFRELGIPEPDFNLGVGSGSHGEQTARMIAGIEQVLLDVHFDGVILYGDTNSTLAGAVAASKCHVPIFHVEAGLRSFDMTMPEEINRVVCDHLSSILFAPTATACKNLEREGLVSSPVAFSQGRKRVVINCGDVMYDNCMYFAPLAEARSDVMQRYGLKKEAYILTTVHRAANTDDPRRLTSIFRALLDIAEQDDVKVVLPLHPRTAKLLPSKLDSSVYDRVIRSDRLLLIPPASFYDIIVLERNARIVMTDSGGVQKEAFFFERPSLIFRSETEWLEIIENGAGFLADADYDRILEGYNRLSRLKVSFPRLFGDADAAGRIMSGILAYLK